MLQRICLWSVNQMICLQIYYYYMHAKHQIHGLTLPKWYIYDQIKIHRYIYYICTLYNYIHIAVWTTTSVLSVICGDFTEALIFHYFHFTPAISSEIESHEWNTQFVSYVRKIKLLFTKVHGGEDASSSSSWESLSENIKTAIYFDIFLHTALTILVSIAKHISV